MFVIMATMMMAVSVTMHLFSRERISFRDLVVPECDLYAKGGLKSGVAHLALDSGVEIIPITINNVGRILPPGIENAITNEKITVLDFELCHQGFCVALI